MKKELSAEDIKNALDGMMPEYQRADEMMLYGWFTSEAARIALRESRLESEVLEELMKEESFKRYKAMDRGGNVKLIQNSALMTWQVAQKVTHVQDIIRERYQPDLPSNSSQAKKQSAW